MRLLRTWSPALGLALLVWGAGARARAQAYDASYQTWASLTLAGDAHPDVQLYVDLNGRFYDDFHPFQILVRPAIGVRLSPGMHAWLGYGWTPSWSATRLFTDEHRIWEQWTWDVPGLPDGLRFFLRTRLEQRMRPEIGSDVALRLRQMVRVIVPFARGSEWGLSLWDEAFVGLTDSAHAADPVAGRTAALWQRAGFDQNRLFVGLSWGAAPGVRVEAGYLNHWVVREGRDDVHHVGAINGFVTFR